MSANDPFHLTGKPVVVGTGLISLDLVIGPEDVAPSGLYAGGTCGNLLIILSYLGWKSYPVSRLNGDKASKYVVDDMVRWGVQTGWAKTKPGSKTPIITQRIKQTQDGEVTHRFSWTCPKCGGWLPSYAAVPAGVARTVTERIKSPDVFFFDRVSRGAINLAQIYAKEGALVVFEPSGVGDPRLFCEALKSSHMVKYSAERIDQIKGLSQLTGPLLEIQTRGADGLRYRQLGSGVSKWISLPAIRANGVKDTSGAGDWCCAGVIHCLGMKGLKGFQASTSDQIRSGIKFGQAMAAWNCKFKGARGGMYTSAKRTFRIEVRQILEGNDVAIDRPLEVRHAEGKPFTCLAAACNKRPKSHRLPR